MSARTGWGAYGAYVGGLGVASGGVDCLKRVDFTGFGLQPVGGVVCKPSCCETYPNKERVLGMASGGVDCLKRVTFGGGWLS